MEALQPDVVCLQETRVYGGIEPDLRQFGFGTVVYSHAEKKGYSGTLLMSKEKPMSVETQVPFEPVPHEGRVIVAEYERFFIVNVYVPNAKMDLSRLPYRANHWDPSFCSYLCELEKKKPVIVCGDFNVAHQEIDLVNPASNRFNPGFTDEERQGFSNYLNKGFVDIFRERHPGQRGLYTWWSYRAGARARNIGWRIDYFLISPSLAPAVEGASIYERILGSDHAPVRLRLTP